MATYDWRRRPTRYFGDVWVPFALIEIQAPDGHYQTFSLQIDAGAVISLLRRSVADLLGIELEAGRRIELGSVGGGPTPAYVHELKTRFDQDVEFPVRFAIAEVETVPNLLGRLDVFDRLQFDFDPSLEWTRIADGWLRPDDRHVWDLLIDAEKHILARWDELGLPEPAPEAASRFIRRAEQIVAAAMGTVKMGHAFAAPAYVRAMFELAVQFEYLMQDPTTRARQYLAFSSIKRHKFAEIITKHPKRPIALGCTEYLSKGGRLAELKAEYERNRRDFEWQNSKGRTCVATDWYDGGKTFEQLAKDVGWSGEYDIWYRDTSNWIHGNPFSTESDEPAMATRPWTVLQLCSGYYARMLLRVSRNIILTATHHELLTGLAQPMD